MEWILLVLIAVVLVFGIGVVLVPRLRAGRELPPAPTRPAVRPPAPVIERPVEAPPVDAEADTAVEPADDADAEPADDVDTEPPDDADADAEAGVDVLEPLVIERPRLRDRLVRARSAFAGAFTSVRSRGGITDETWDDLEEALLTADVGVGLTTELLDGLRAQAKAEKLTDPSDLLDRLKDDISTRLHATTTAADLRFEPEPGHPVVWLFVGVNGVGKTTTIGKVAAQQSVEGRRVLLAAGDTFRAAAAEQLGTWAERSGAELVRGAEGSDPSAVIFDGISRAAALDIPLVLADTAGRLHTKTNLMDELRKVRRVADKDPGRVQEVLLVIDATTGQNGLVQARQFTEAVEVTGVVLTKLDGSAKGGIVLAIGNELGLPVKLVGVGETIGDLMPFDPDEFVDALFAQS